MGLLEDGQKLLNESCKQRGIHLEYCLSQGVQKDIRIRPTAIAEESTSAIEKEVEGTSAIETVIEGDSVANIEEV